MAEAPRFLEALRRRAVDRTPVWFMRQAGRYMPEYRALREKHSILEICKTAELAAEVTLQPLKRFPGLDAAIIFSDILLVLEPMGIEVTFVKSEGPAIRNPIATQSDVDALKSFEPQYELACVYDAIRMVKREIDVPLIGFAGAPFTLASYMIEGGPSKDFARTKALMKSSAWPRLMTRLAAAVAKHLRAQAAAGVDAVQLFDSWVGNLTPDEYRDCVMPYTRRILDTVPVPAIHFGTQTAPFLDLMAQAGGAAVGVDWRIPLDEAWSLIGEGKAIQGNLDPHALLGSREALIPLVDDVLDRAGGRPGHVFNLGHGILPTTPLDNVAAVIDRVHERSAR